MSRFKKYFRITLVLSLIIPLTQLSIAPSAQAKKDFPSFKGKTFQGSGDDVVEFEVDKPAVVRFSCLACEGNVSVTSDGRESLLVNEIGAYSGEHLINMNSGSFTTTFEVTADASWTLSISDLNSAKRVAGKSASGKGDSVLYVPGSFSKVSLKNVGSGNFAIYAWPKKPSPFTFPLLVNEIGSYKGTKKVKMPGVIYVISSGDWTLSFGK